MSLDGTVLALGSIAVLSGVSLVRGSRGSGAVYLSSKTRRLKTAMDALVDGMGGASDVLRKSAATWRRHWSETAIASDPRGFASDSRILLRDVEVRLNRAGGRHAAGVDLDAFHTAEVILRDDFGIRLGAIRKLRRPASSSVGHRTSA